MSDTPRTSALAAQMEPLGPAERMYSVGELWSLAYQLERELVAAQATWREVAAVRDTLSAQCAELTARVVELERDAGRYRWLRDSPRSFWHTQNPDAAPGLAERIDVHIDAAMEAK